MATRDFLVIRGGLSRDGDAPDLTSDLRIRRLPLSQDVIAGFIVVHAVPPAEPVTHPLEASRTVSRMPDGRYVATEVAGEAGAVIGEPVSLIEAVAIANRVLRRGQAGDALDAHALAVAYLGLVNRASRYLETPYDRAFDTRGPA